MGWERKRGKLHELNRLLRGATDTTFIAIDGRRPAAAARRPLRHHARCRHADCRATRARRLVGKMAHPLNRPRFDPAGRPRRRGLRRPATARDARRCRSVAQASPFQRVFSNASGIDPYAFSGLRCLSGSVRRRAPTPARASTTSMRSRAALPGRVPGKYAAQPRSVRRHLRARGPRVRRRGGRGISRRATTLPRAPAPLGARRLAAAAVDVRARVAATMAERGVACRPSVAGR